MEHSLPPTPPLLAILYATPANVHRVVVKGEEGRGFFFFNTLIITRKKYNNKVQRFLDVIDLFILEVKFALPASKFSSDMSLVYCFFGRMDFLEYRQISIEI